MPKISFSLNTASIEAAIKELNSYSRKVKNLAGELVKKLTEMGVEIAKFNVADMKAYDSGDLYNSIHAEYSGENVGFVIADSGHAAFVEFGTGVVGAGNQHPEVAVFGWKYDVNEHGELGWWYLGKDGKPHWTKGMPSRPYMWQTARKLRDLYGRTAKELMK